MRHMREAKTYSPFFPYFQALQARGGNSFYDVEGALERYYLRAERKNPGLHVLVDRKQDAR